MLNALVIRAEDLFLPKYIERYIHTLEGSLYKKDYLALLVIIGGHPGGLPVNSKTEKNNHLYLVQSIDLITKEILVLTNNHSKDHMKTLNFSSSIKEAFMECNTLLF